MTMDKKERSFYNAVHFWLRSKRGVAKICENKECTGKSNNFQWAKKKGKEYDFKTSNFFQLCRSCHAKYDCTEETKEKLRIHSTKVFCVRGHKLSKNNTTFVNNRGKLERRCISCHNIRQRIYMAKKKEIAGHKYNKAEVEKALKDLREIK